MKKSFKAFLSLIFLLFCGYIFLFPSVENLSKGFSNSTFAQQKTNFKSAVQKDNNKVAFHANTDDADANYCKIISTELEVENDDLSVQQKAIQPPSYFQHFYTRYAAQIGCSLASPFAKTSQFYAYGSLRYIFFQSFRV